MYLVKKLKFTIVTNQKEKGGEEMYLGDFIKTTAQLEVKSFI